MFEFPQLVKRFENLVVQHDQTVRDASGNVVQFHYGDDGLEGAVVVRLPVPVRLSKWTDISDMSCLVSAIDEQKVLDASDVFFKEWELRFDENLVSLFCDVDQIIERAAMFDKPVVANSDCVNEIWEMNKRLLAPCKVELHRQFLVRALQTKKISLIPTKWRQWLCHELEHKLLKSQVAPGESVGVLAAQSISEPATQVSIKTSFAQIMM